MRPKVKTHPPSDEEGVKRSLTEGEKRKTLPQYVFLLSNGVAAKKKTHETKLIILLSYKARQLPRQREHRVELTHPSSDEEGVKQSLTEGERMKPYNKNNISLAKMLRKNMTPWELKLWHRFLKIYPVRFQRQKAIGNYIVDFYCAKAQFAIELDGSKHCYKEQVLKDIFRTKELNAMGVKVIRISNLDIDKNFTGVCHYIDKTVKLSLSRAKHDSSLNRGSMGDS